MIMRNSWGRICPDYAVWTVDTYLSVAIWLYLRYYLSFSHLLERFVTFVESRIDITPLGGRTSAIIDNTIVVPCAYL